MPCRGSTTMPSTRRSSPQTFSTSSASCLPSTQMRLALATCARCPATRTEPDAVRPAPAAGAVFFGAGGIRRMGWPSKRKPKPRRKDRDLPRRSSRATTCMPPDFSTRVTAPTQPDWTSSRTIPRSTGTSGNWVLAGADRSWGPQFWYDISTR